MDHLISARRPDILTANKKRTCGIVDFAIPAENWVKIKESEKRDKLIDLARELKKKKLSYMKVTMVPIEVGALGTIPKEMVKGLEDLKIRGQAETIQTTTLLRLARIMRKVLETLGGLLSLKTL